MKRDRQKVEALRTACFDRAKGRCEWPTCTAAPEHMAHITPRSLGGPDELWNVAALCVWHHDILDGRSHQGLSRELSVLLRAALGRWK